LGGAVGLGLTVRRWQARSASRNAKALRSDTLAVPAKRDEYDARLDDELKDLDG